MGKIRVGQLLAAVAVIIVHTPTHAATLRTVALTGQHAAGTPDGNTFVRLQQWPAINAAGQTAFFATLDGDITSGGYHRGIWSEGSGRLRLVAGSGDPAPGAPLGINFNYFDFEWYPILNAAGQTAFVGRDSTLAYGIWAEGEDGVRMVAREGSQLLGTTHTFSGVTTIPKFNAAGQIAMTGGLSNGTRGVWSEISGSLQLVAVNGQPAPGTLGIFRLDGSTDIPSLNDAGHVAFAAPSPRGIWSDRSGQLEVVALSGQPAPGAPPGFSFQGFRSVRLNNADQIAFWATVTAPDGSSSRGIWAEQAGDLRLVARTGNSAPGFDAGVTFSSFTVGTAFNDAGQTAFYASLAGPSVDSTNNTSIWSEGSGELKPVVRKGDPAPGGPPGVLFTGFLQQFLTSGPNGVYLPAINTAGQTAFFASLSDGSGGIWATDRRGLLRLVAKTGDSMEVAPGDFRTIDSIGFRTIRIDEFFRAVDPGLNDAGQIAFWAQFTDGSQGIFVSNAVAVPEPTSLLVLALSGLLILLPSRWFNIRRRSLASLTAAVCTAAPYAAHAVTIDTVPIGNPNNAADIRYADAGHPNGVGSVPYSFRIGATEITNAQYVEFLNAVAASDTLWLYDESMAEASLGGIVRSGETGSYTYAVKPPAVGEGSGGTDYYYQNKPVVYVDWFRAARFTNWLHNGQQGPGTTEDGAYTLLGGTPIPTNYETVTRNPGARWWLPSLDEWYKAAYHKNDGATGNYWDYPTGTNTELNNVLPASDTGNSANFNFTTDSGDFPVTDVGAYSISKSSYSTLDQGGNVQEWTDTLLGGSRPTPGGSWFDDLIYLHASSFGVASSPTSDFFFVGFRVASVIPEPSTTLLLVIGGLALLGQRRQFVRASFPAALNCPGSSTVVG